MKLLFMLSIVVFEEIIVVLFKAYFVTKLSVVLNCSYFYFIVKKKEFLKNGIHKTQF